MILSIVLFIICSKDDGERSLARRAIEAAKEVDDKENVTTAPVIDHSYDPFPVTSEEWANRNPFAEDQPTRKLSQEQDEPDTAVKSRTPSPSTESSKSPKSCTTNPSPQSNDQFSTDNRCITVPKHSVVSSIESGYESNMSTPPGSVQTRSTKSCLSLGCNPWPNTSSGEWQHTETTSQLCT